MEPQLALGGVQPDFVFRSNDQTLPSLAVFCDGWQFHASPAINRIADDARKREQLRQQGYAVVGITWADLQAAKNGTTAPPEWFSPARWTHAMQQSQGKLKPGMQDLAVGGPIDYIVRWVSRPDPEGFRALSDAIPLLLAGAGPTGKTEEDESLFAVTKLVHDGEQLSANGSRHTWAWRHDTLTVVARVLGGPGTAAEISAMLDDREDRLGHNHKSAWREWLRISTLLNLRLLPTRLSSHSLIEEAQAATTSDGVELAEPWKTLFGGAVSAIEKDLIEDMASADVAVPELGYETANGLPLDISWPEHRVVVEIDFPKAERDELAADGWTLVRPDIAEIRDALTAAGGR